MASVILDTVLQSIGTIVIAGGGISLIVWAIFKTLSTKWLDAKFNERLEAYKHAQQRELEDVRFQINKQMDRLTKLHQREFEILPEAWGRLVEAYHSARALVGAFQSYPNIEGMNGQQLEDFLENCPLAKWQKDELKTHYKKNEYYKNAIFWVRLSDCRKQYYETKTYLTKNSIFFPRALSEKFNELEDLIWGAIVEHEVYEGSYKRDEYQARDKLEKVGRPLLDKLEELVHSDLWGLTKTDDGTIAANAGA